MVGDPTLRRAAAALASYRLAELDPRVAMVVFAHAPGGATTTGVVSPLGRLRWSPTSKGALHRYLERLRRYGVVEGRGRSLRVCR
ncbi:hypothetical protein Gocc_0466 [Gaiella occulta]|uniref:Uncharacterized protein n=1 Tax=Gaiella occulta TaxID=1002870 RepID=A0A7M2Z129_9ACTN|nr:hypothetical protein Gocc_0466 [Gaiella occulta]